MATRRPKRFGCSEWPGATGFAILAISLLRGATQASDREDKKMLRSSSSSPIAASPSWPIAVFAHNEAKNIVACLDSLYCAASGGRKIEILVLANGCSDLTEQKVIEYARTHREVKLISIELSDKANAWNTYVHDIAPDREIHFFIDGDVEACPEAINRLYTALHLHPEAHAAAAFPITGRSLAKWRGTMLEETLLAGNLYALSGTFISRMRRCGVYLPVGWIMEDGLVGALAKWDMDPTQPWEARRIIPCPEAGFRFNSLSWLYFNHWLIYWRRRIRYSIGFYQTRMLRPVLKQEGIDGMPVSVQDLYRKSQGDFSIRWTCINQLFDWIALRRIKLERQAFIKSQYK